MTGSDTRIAIVGGGLAGLVAALQLAQQGVREVVLFEARDVLGGRILSVDASASQVDAGAPALDRFDLGPSWFWPELQPQLDQLVEALGLQRFVQFEDGDLMVERSAQQVPQRMRGFPSAPPAMRLVGGTGALVAALHGQLPDGIVHTGTTLRRLHRTGSHVTLTLEDAAGATATWRAQQVLLALPPRLAEASLTADPPLPPDLGRRWRATPTWMAPHAKYVALFETPFWRAKGLSGGARSGRGRWARSTTSRCRAATRHCSASWACRRRRGAGSTTPCCARTVAHNWADCSATAPLRPWPMR